MEKLPRYGLDITHHPKKEPVEIGEFRMHLHQNVDETDLIMQAYIAAARKLFETSTNRQLITATWTLTVDHWYPEILIPLAPIQSINSITYTDSNGQVQAYTDFKLWKNILTLNTSINTTAVPALSIEFVAGYGDAAASVPQSIRQAIRLLATDYAENRSSTLDYSPNNLPQGWQYLVSHYKLHNFGTITENHHTRRAYPYDFCIW